MRFAIPTLVLSALLGPAAQAVPVLFEYSGADGLTTASGFLVINDALFDETAFQVIEQTHVLAFSMTMQSGATTDSWGFGDLVLASAWFFDSTSAIPDIVGQSGYIVAPPQFLIAASTGSVGSYFGSVSSGDWVYSGAVSVPEPGTPFLLLSGLLALGFARCCRSTRRVPLVPQRTAFVVARAATPRCS